jgi:hypothetical protein
MLVSLHCYRCLSDVGRCLGVLPLSTSSNRRGLPVMKVMQVMQVLLQFPFSCVSSLSFTHQQHLVLLVSQVHGDHHTLCILCCLMPKYCRCRRRCRSRSPRAPPPPRSPAFISDVI